MRKKFTSQNLKQENEILPYETKKIPDGSWIVFAPHFDDETIGMGGSLLLAKENNIPVTLVIMTDGKLGGVDTNTRENETKEVARVLNITNLVFLNHEDRNIVLDEHSIQSIVNILNTSDANILFLPSAMEPHPDHRMTTEMVWKALAMAENNFEVYAYEISVQNQINHLVDITSVMEKKKSLMGLYQSQLKQNHYIDFMVSMSRLRTYTLSKEVEYAEGFYFYGNQENKNYQNILSQHFGIYTKKYLYSHNVPLRDFCNCINPQLALVSVVTPCFNDVEHLQETLNSIYQQTYSNIEIIVVNDASTQKLSIDFLKKLETYNLIVIHLDENSGPSVARNRAISRAQGQYILPLDAGDKIALTYIEKGIQVLEKNPKIGIVYCEAEYIGNKSGKWDLPEYSLENMFTGNLIFATAMYRKDDWKRAGGYDEKMKKGWEDYDFWLSLLELEVDVLQIQEVLLSYRIKESSRTTQVLGEIGKVALQQQIFNNHKDFYIKNIGTIFTKINYLNDISDTKIKEVNQQNTIIKQKDIELKEKTDQLKEKTDQLKEKESQLHEIMEIAQSLRLKNRFKRVIKSFLGKKIWNVLQYIKRNPNTLKKGLKVLRREGIKVFINKLRNVSKVLHQSNMYQYRDLQLNEKIKIELKNFKKKPLISIIMPVYNVDPQWLKLAIQSIKNQWYTHWELCICDDKSTNQETIQYLKNINDSKIKIKFLEKNLNISGASNEALGLASGEYIALMDNDDEITPNALFEVVKAINENDAKFIYSDEDKIDMKGNYCDPHYKPDFSHEMFMCQNYLSHLGVIEKGLIDKVNGFTIGLEGAQDYDLYLKVLEHTEKIYHIPKVLYHWRKIPGSTAVAFDEKSYAQNAGKRALQNRLERKNIDAKAVNTPFPGLYKTNYTIKNSPLVSIIIPFKDMPELLITCVESIINKSTYTNIEIIGISNNSQERETFDAMKKLESLDSRIKFYEYNIPFNYSQINNYAVDTYAKGTQILLLNNDIEIISANWIEEMLMFSEMEGIGCVGAKLYYPDDTIQHGGVIVGLSGVACHSHKRFERHHPGYFRRLQSIQNLSAVTAACLMVKKSIYVELNGLNENDLAVTFNDVDFCLRTIEKGYRNVFTPYCEAYHHESISRGAEDTPQKIERFNKEINYMQKRHSIILKNGDPYYNINLTLSKEDFSLRL